MQVKEQGSNSKSLIPAGNECQELEKVREKKNLTEEQMKKALARADLVHLYRAYSEKIKRPRNRVKAKREFVELYNQAEHGTYPALFQIVGTISFKTIERWDILLKLNNEDPTCLADLRGTHRRDKHRISKEQIRILTSCALNPNQPKKSEVIRAARERMEAEGIPCLLSDKQLRNILNEDEKRRANIWIGAREGQKAHNDKCVFHIKRDWNKVGVGDILFSDGHINNFPILCPFTGKPKRMTLLGWYDGHSEMPIGWEIMPTENVQCISTALRRAIIALGKWPLDGTIAYLDNGKAFRAKFFKGVADFRQAQILGLYRDIGMDVIHAWPHHAESKTIEPFWGLFSELERRLPAYTGTSIEKKPAHLKRGEKLHKALHEKFFSGYIPTIYEAHQLIAGFFDEYSQRVKKSGHLKGKRPIDVFMDGKGPGLTPEQIAELNMLMMPSTPVRITSNGVKLPGKPDFYYHPALFGRMDTVIVRHDWHPDSFVYVYELDGTFICEATIQPKVHPAAGKHGTEAERAELKRQIAMKRNQEKQTFGIARELLKQDILPEVQKRLESIGIVRKEAFEAHSRETHQAKQPEQLSPLDDEAKKRIQEELEELRELNSKPEEPGSHSESEEGKSPSLAEPSIWQKLQTMSELDRYEGLLECEAQGMLIPKSFLSFMRYFEDTGRYRQFKDYFEERRAAFAIVYRGLRQSAGSVG